MRVPRVDAPMRSAMAGAVCAPSWMAENTSSSIAVFRAAVR